MLYQDLIGTIIGSAIATVGSIGVWVIIEFLKKYLDKRRLRKKFRLLYEQFEKRKHEPYMTIKMAGLIDEIGKKNFLNILKSVLHSPEGARSLHSNEFIVNVIFAIGNDTIEINYKGLRYYFKKPNENQECLDKFLEFYRKQCKNEGISLKKESE